MHLRIQEMSVDGERTPHEIVTTSEHPFWVQGKAWQEAGKLKGLEWGKDTFLEAVGDQKPQVVRISRLFRTNHPDVAWFPIFRSPTSGGTHLNIRDFVVDDSYTGPVQFESLANTGRIKPEHLYRTTVYNIEVEDFHTYFVTPLGVWVHNTKEVKVRPGVGGEPLSAALAKRPLFSRPEVEAIMNQAKHESKGSATIYSVND